MAKKRNGVNKSEEIRQLLKANPQLGEKETRAKLAERGIKVSSNLFYFVKGQMKGRKAQKNKAQRAVARIANSTHVSRSDAVATILKVMSCADEVGGLKALKALVDALSE